jgi:hypothetical protein
LESPLKDTPILLIYTHQIKGEIFILWHYLFKLFKERPSIDAGFRGLYPSQLSKKGIANGFAEDGAHVILSSCKQADLDKAARDIQNNGRFC